MQNLKQLWIDRLGEENLDFPLGDGVFPSASEYIQAGVFPEEYDRWYQVGAWDIKSMIELEEHETIDVDQLGQFTDEGSGGYSHTIAYKYCNGDLSIEQVLRILE